MRIAVGSTNRTKVDGVTLGVAVSDLLRGAEIIPVKIVIEEFGQPIGFGQVITGAMERAQQAFHDVDLSVGIEGGLINAPHTKSGYFEVAVCAIYDGKQFHLGMSPGCEWPVKVTKMIINDGLDGSQAMREAGLTTEEKIGANGGAIALLSHGKIDRTECNRLAFIMALVHLENVEHY